MAARTPFAKGKEMRIAIVAPSCRIDHQIAEQVTALAAANYPDLQLAIHPQCFLEHGHFAGPDHERAAAFVEAANDPGVDAIWFARGGYGSNRIAEAAVARLGPAARDKIYLGYSDGGFLLAALYRAGMGRLAHGPMPADIKRSGGGQAVLRALGWLAGDRSGLEPGLDARPAAAFNITVLSQLLGTPLEPDLSDHVLLLEEVSEHTYRTDRTLFHITSQAAIRRVAGIRLGRCSLVPTNDLDFGRDEEAVAREWCERAAIPWLGRADIGHDSDNKVVPFGPQHR
jgi:muramoyltetrapeptide carboxypeptidase